VTAPDHRTVRSFRLGHGTDPDGIALWLREHPQPEGAVVCVRVPSWRGTVRLTPLLLAVGFALLVLVSQPAASGLGPLLLFALCWAVAAQLAWGACLITDFPKQLGVP
jgi:hypothetical protein